MRGVWLLGLLLSVSVAQEGAPNPITNADVQRRWRFPRLPITNEGAVVWPITVVSVFETQIVTTVLERKTLKIRSFDGTPATNYIPLTNASVVISVVTNSVGQ